MTHRQVVLYFKVYLNLSPILSSPASSTALSTFLPPPSPLLPPLPNAHPKRRLLIHQINLLIIPLGHILPRLLTQLEIEVPQHFREDEFHFGPGESIRSSFTVSSECIL